MRSFLAAAGLFYRDGQRGGDVGRRGSQRKGVFARVDLPAARLRVPERQRLPVEFELHDGAFAGGQGHFPEAFQLLFRPEDRRGVLRDVELHDLRALAVARVGQRDAHLQRLVGGDMQAVYPWSKDNVALICNDSGKVDGLPLNRCIEDYDVIAGNFFICGFSGEEFCSLTDKQFRRYEKLFRDPELFLPTPIGIMPMKCTPDQYKRLMQERSAANRGER